MPAGRPSKMTDECLKKLEEAFAMDCSVGEACFYADISQVTYYAWIKDNPELLNRFEALRENPVLLARRSVINKMQDDGDLALKYLERKRKKEFAVRNEVTGGDGEPLQVKVINYGDNNTTVQVPTTSIPDTDIESDR